MDSIQKFFAAGIAALGLTAAAADAAPTGWTPYTIRSSPTINDNYGGDPNATQFIVNGSGTKAGLGTNNLNGYTIGQIGQLQINRDDNYARFLTSEGAYYAPYMNIWVKDAQGQVAVLANEPSNAEWTGTSEWNTTGANLATKTVKVFENEAGFDLPSGITLGAGGLTNGTFADFAGYEIISPSNAYLVANEPNGSGAPRDLSTFNAYGFNWIFGDTGANYVSDTTGFIVSSPVATAVPEPTGIALIGLGAGALLLRRRRNVA
jgi:hypothetical protein